MDGSDMGRGHRLRGIECKDRYFFDKRVQTVASNPRKTGGRRTIDAD